MNNIAKAALSLAQDSATFLNDMANKSSCDFFSSAQTTPWASSVLSSGTITSVSTTAKHPGVLGFLSATSANSGYSFRAGVSSMVLSGQEKSTIIFQTPASQNTITTRMGFLDTTDYNDTIDGCYGEIVNGVLYGKTANNSVRSQTPSSYTLSGGTWYRLKIELNSNATQVTFTLYADDSNTILWQDTLNTNIPTTTGRETAHGIVSTSSGTSQIALVTLDYMDMVLPNARRVV